MCCPSVVFENKANGEKKMEIPEIEAALQRDMAPYNSEADLMAIYNAGKKDQLAEIADILYDSDDKALVIEIGIDYDQGGNKIGDGFVVQTTEKNFPSGLWGETLADALAEMKKAVQ